MPYEIRRRGSRYDVVNTATGELHAKGTTKRNAEKQLRLLNGVEHGFTPTHGGVISRETRDGTRVNFHVKPKRKRGQRG